jgi:hypothetical protein
MPTTNNKTPTSYIFKRGESPTKSQNIFALSLKIAQASNKKCRHFVKRRQIEIKILMTF